MEAALQQQAERYLGTAIRPGEWGRAKISAEQKLRHIIEHYGDSGGKRREPWYMARLIAEAVTNDRFSQYTQCLWEAQAGTKKDSPCPKTQGRLYTSPYCSTVSRKMQ